MCAVDPTLIGEHQGTEARKNISRTGSYIYVFCKNRRDYDIVTGDKSRILFL